VSPLDGACATSLTAGANIRALREKRKWAQIDLALCAEVSQAAVCLAETGQRNLTLAMLEKIAGALDVQPHELLKPGDPS
jgi:transcriptional regulator with XRE-family HTH domain